MQIIPLSVVAAMTLAAAAPAIAQGTAVPPPAATTMPAPAATTTGVAPADRPSNNDQPSLAGQVVPSPQNTAAHNPAIFERDQLPILAHTFNFTDAQKQEIRDALAPAQNAASDVTLAEGTELSQPVDAQPLPDSVAERLPWVKPYKYVKVGGKIAIIDPNLPVVVSIIE
jgi:hypothetical protein